MALQGIDISNWQSGIKVAGVSGIDFVIMKATQGTSYVSPDFSRQYSEAKAAGKLLGVYHYIGGQGAEAEAKHFVSTVKSCLGEAMIVLDWESEQNSKWGNESYLEALVKQVKQLAGYAPVIYASKSSFPWSLAKKHGCGTWVAQYANNNATGLQQSPWNEGAYSCDIRQYSSCGRLSGYSGNLDLNKAYMDKSGWSALCGSSAASGGTSSGSGNITATTTSKLDVDGLWGKKTTKRSQEAFGTEADSIISRQPSRNKKYVACAQSEAWEWLDSGYKKGSPFVKAVQKWAGLTGDDIDGWWGNQTSTYVQKKLKGFGYSIDVDGYFGAKSCKVWQQALNDGKIKA